MTTNVLPCEQMDLFSDVNFYEYSVLILNSPIVLNALRGKTNSQKAGGNFCSRKEDLQKFASTRLKELEAWVDSGGTLIVFLDQYKEITFPSRTNTGVLDTATLADFFPFDLLDYRRRAGSLITYIGPPRYRQALASCCELMEYKMILDGESIEPLFGVAGGGSRQVVGGFIPRVKGGMMIFLPITSLWNQVGGEADSARDHVIEAAIEFALACQPKTTDLPSWHVQYQLPKEQGAAEGIQALRLNLEGIEKKIGDAKRELRDLQKLKHLLFGYDKDFEDAAILCLEAIGFKAQKGPYPHADILSWGSDTLVVTEAKGLIGPAREKNTGQCLRWIGEAKQAYSSSIEEIAGDPVLERYKRIIDGLGAPDFDEDNMIPFKGMMLIGTYRELPLEERSEPDFPHAMLRNVRANRFCTITGAQLLSIWCHIQAKPNDKERIRNALISTDGVFEEFTDWREYIELNKL